MPVIRKATTSDIPALINIHNQARRSGMPWLPQLHSHASDLNFFENRVLPNYHVHIYEQDDRAVGYIALDTDWIEQLYLLPEVWRMGIGSKLLALGLRDVSYRQLWVFKQNATAQAFYKSHGFVPVEETDGSNNEEGCPDIRMEWRRQSII
jgi:ribosomal protein S18 acetylase RimI-like enzyme